MLLPLPNPAFFDELIRRIGAAKKSIRAVNYLAELPAARTPRGTDVDPVRRLARALIAAKRRGVEVAVVLEGSKIEENYPFFRMLKDEGVDVWLDTSRTFIHHKVALIDDRFLFAGSHNLTRASMADNEEFSLLTDDAGAVRSFTCELEKITRQREQIRREVCREGVRLPSGFLTGIAAPLYRVHAGHAFDLYLLLCREDGGRPRPLPIREREWATALGFDPGKAGKGITEHYRRYFFTQRINRILSQLRDRFRIVAVDRRRDTVTRIAPALGGPRLFIPETCWRYGWPQRLSLAAKYFYLISLAETEESPFHPWWSRSIRALVKRYRCDSGIGRGARELADAGLLEILRAVPIQRRGIYFEEAQHYRLNPFYDMARFEEALGRLEEKFSVRVVAAARRTAALFWRSHDLEALEAVCTLIRGRGMRRVSGASRRIARLPTSSSRRCLDHLAQLVGR